MIKVEYHRDSSSESGSKEAPCRTSPIPQVENGSLGNGLRNHWVRDSPLWYDTFVQARARSHRDGCSVILNKVSVSELESE